MGNTFNWSAYIRDSWQIQPNLTLNVGGPAILIGLPWGDGPFVYNAVALLDRGRIESVRYKNNLPNYGVFDEARVFAPGPPSGPGS